MAKTLGSTNLRVGANIGPLKAALKTASAKLRRFGSTAKKVGGTLSRGLSAPIAIIGATSVKVFADFESEMSKVKAVSGATAEQLKMLTANAKQLGSTTVFTARDVASLQVEFAKLGFTASEIDKVTESTLYLAQASGSDLARAAEVAGATLRGFGLDAEETGRVTDVMALSFASSALDMEAFAESMKYVAPIANAAGIGIEETTAMLELLANAGIKGSMAGTAMKKIIGELGSTSEGVAGAIKKLAKEGIQLADAKDEVGERAQAALLVLANGIDTVDGLTDALLNSSGAAKTMGQEMTDNTAGAFKILKSAIEGAQIELGENIAKNKIFKGILESLTKTLGKITDHIKGMTDAEQFNAVALAGIVAVVPLVISAIGSLTLAFGTLTAAMGPVAIAIAAVAGAYALIRKSVNETDKAIKNALLNENTKESTKLLEDQLAVVQKSLANSMKWAKRAPRNIQYQKQINQYTKEETDIKEALAALQGTEDDKAKVRQASKDAAAKEELENLRKIKEAHSATAINLDKVNKAYQNVSLQSSDALHRLGEKFVEIQRKAESFHSTANDGMKQAIDLTGGLAFEFSTNLGNAIAGAIINGDSFSKSFITSLKAMAAQLVATIALVAILATLLVIATGGLSGLSFGSVLTGMKAVSKGAGIAVPFLAEGGIVTGPTLAMVGEGRESEAVIPLSKLDNMMGSNSGAVTVYGKISGQDILLSSEKASRTRSRYRGF